MIKRIQHDINVVHRHETGRLEGRYYFPDQENLTVGYGLIRGPPDTPYEGGFYLIKFEFLGEYPFKPPVCTYLSVTTTRQNPNFHDQGKVCLSRLNTWEPAEYSDGWLATMDINTILVMIQGQVLTKVPLDNEPSYDHSLTHPENAKIYEEVVRYYNFRGNVLDLYARVNTGQMATIPADIQTEISKIIGQYVSENKPWYIRTLNSLIKEHDGRFYKCVTYTNAECRCHYSTILNDVIKIFGKKIQVTKKRSS